MVKFRKLAWRPALAVAAVAVTVLVPSSFAAAQGQGKPAQAHIPKTLGISSNQLVLGDAGKLVGVEQRPGESVDDYSKRLGFVSMCDKTKGQKVKVGKSDVQLEAEECIAGPLSDAPAGTMRVQKGDRFGSIDANGKRVYSKLSIAELTARGKGDGK